MSLLLFTGLVIAVVGVLLAGFGLYRLLKLKLGAGIRYELAGLGLLLTGAFLLLVSSNLVIYQRLVFESPVASIVFMEKEPRLFLAEVRPMNQLAQNYELQGDEWQLDARILKWHGVANVLGLDTQYRLHRLQGRYTDIGQERVATRSVYAIGEQPEMDIWKLANDYELLLGWLVDAAYGSAVYLPMTDGAEYEISVSQSGLVARPVNDPAKQAVSRWIGF